MSRGKLFSITILLAVPLFSVEPEFPAIKPAPFRPSAEADVVVDWVETLDECWEEKVCVQGQLYNQGKKPANNVRLRIEIGGTKYTTPRMVLIRKVEQTLMNPGDRQDFDLTIDRKIPYRDKGEEKVLEVGKFNFKVVPAWNKPGESLSRKKSKKSSKTTSK